MIKTKSVCFSGHRASKMPFDEKSLKHERLEALLKMEIIKLIREGYTEFYVGGQNGIDEVVSLIILSVRDELFTTLNLHMIIPYRGMQKKFTLIQKDNFEYIEKEADEVVYLNESYTKDCYRQRNQYMVDRSDLLLAVFNGDKRSGTAMTINMAKLKGISVNTIKL